MQETGLEERIAIAAREVAKAPPLIGQKRLHHRHWDQVIQFFQLARDQGAGGPGADQRDIEAVASSLCLEAARSGWAGGSIRCDPVAEAGSLAHEAPVIIGLLHRVPVIGPFAINKHWGSPYRGDRVTDTPDGAVRVLGVGANCGSASRVSDANPVVGTFWGDLPRLRQILAAIWW